jgi:acetyltransferase-like isoleucine patch superfamily enzyme
MSDAAFVIDEDSERKGSIVVGRNCNFSGARIYAKVGASVQIGDNAVVKGTIIAERGSAVTIGNNFVCNSPVDIRAGGGASVSFGSDCLLADVKIYATDYHEIFDAESGEVLNKPRDVTIGDRVWLAMRSIVLKGASIGNDSVVAAGSVVSGGSFPGNSLLMGVPAAVKRSGIKWRR